MILGKCEIFTNTMSYRSALLVLNDVSDASIACAILYFYELDSICQKKSSGAATSQEIKEHMIYFYYIYSAPLIPPQYLEKMRESLRSLTSRDSWPKCLKVSASSVYLTQP